MGMGVPIIPIIHKKRKLYSFGIIILFILLLFSLTIYSMNGESHIFATHISDDYDPFFGVILRYISLDGQLVTLYGGQIFYDPIIWYTESNETMSFKSLWSYYMFLNLDFIRLVKISDGVYNISCNQYVVNCTYVLNLVKDNYTAVILSNYTGNEFHQVVIIGHNITPPQPIVRNGTYTYKPISKWIEEKRIEYHACDTSSKYNPSRAIKLAIKFLESSGYPINFNMSWRSDFIEGIAIIPREAINKTVAGDFNFIWSIRIIKRLSINGSGHLPFYSGPEKIIAFFVFISDDGQLIMVKKMGPMTVFNVIFAQEEENNTYNVDIIYDRKDILTKVNCSILINILISTIVIAIPISHRKNKAKLY